MQWRCLIWHVGRPACPPRSATTAAVRASRHWVAGGPAVGGEG
jgi:hypothetical protein